MKLMITSDLHLEFAKDGGKRIIDKLETDNVDALVLAGDIFPLRFLDQIVEKMKWFMEKAPLCLFVPGNHEFYKGHSKTGLMLLESAAQQVPGFEVLRAGRVFESHGHRFLGDSMWFPDGPDNNHYADGMSDFHLIQEFVPWVYEQNKAWREFYRANGKPGDIVITHHLPHPACIDNYYKTSVLNRFFLCDMSAEIRELKPALWVHGHTHCKVDVIVDKTRIVCNPKGYPAEATSFNYKGLFVPLF